MATASEVVAENADGRAAVLLVCDHASNSVPPEYDQLGLLEADLQLHTAWDIGALALARRLADALGAPLIPAPVSRLVIDANRDLGAPDLIVETAEGVPVPGNLTLDPAHRLDRISRFHEPFHAAIETFLESRPDIAAVVAVHSFTPRLSGVDRPWHVGVLHDDDARLGEVLFRELTRDASIKVGRNQPYAPADGVYYTLARHGRARALAPVMIEVRNDLLRDEESVAGWAKRLAHALRTALAEIRTGSIRPASGVVKRS